MTKLQGTEPVTVTTARIDLTTRWARLPTEPVALKILSDLKKGSFSFFASEEEMDERYGVNAFYYYKMACKAYSHADGCLVLVDDTNKCYVDSIDVPDIIPDDILTSFLNESGRTYRNSIINTCKPNYITLSLHLLPRADHSKVSWEYIERRGDYLVEGKFRIR